MSDKVLIENMKDTNHIAGISKLSLQVLTANWCTLRNIVT